MHCSKQRKSITLTTNSDQKYVFQVFKKNVKFFSKTKTFFRNFLKYINTIWIKLIIILKAPYVLVLQILCKKCDINSLHPEKLSGEKVNF